MAGDRIVPRWEWRTFGSRFDAAERRLAAEEPGRVESSDDVYLLSARSDASVKVRGGLMDVKQLDQVSGDDLELWRPVLKAAFPLAASDTAFVLRTLNVAVPELTPEAYTIEQLERELIDPNADLLVLRVHKQHAHFDVDGCMVELSEMTASEHATRTIAIESPDPAAVLRTIRALGLERDRNVNVARGLKTLVGFAVRRYTVIDVGTNSVKYHRGERHADGTFHTVADRAEVTRLGEGLDGTGRLAEPAIERTVASVVAMVDDARHAGSDVIFAVGTAGLRAAPNRAALVDAVRDRGGITVEVISGEEEARLAYLAATATLPIGPGRLAVFDSGGGSTQLTFGRPGAIEEQFSVDVGAVRVTERYDLAGTVADDALQAVLGSIATDLARLHGRTRPDTLIGMGGTATNLASVQHGLRTYDAEVVHGTVLTLAELDRQIDLYRTRDADGRREIVGLQPARADVILGGACLVRTIVAELAQDSFTVCDRGLRHGVPLDRLDARPPDT